VVAAKDGTDKAIAARKIPGCILVKAAWLMECYWSMSKQDVTSYLLARGKETDTERMPSTEDGSAPADPLPTEGKNTTREKTTFVVDDSNDDEEDDFAAELEDEMMTISDS
jgi:hypothetical protein